MNSYFWNHSDECLNYLSRTIWEAVRIQWGLPENGGSGGILRWALAATAKSQGSLHNPRAVSWACSRPRSVSRRGQGRGPAGGCGRPAGRGGGRRPGGRAGWGGRGPRSGEGGGRRRRVRTEEGARVRRDRLEKWPEPASGLAILRPVCRVSARYDNRQRFLKKNSINLSSVDRWRTR